MFNIGDKITCAKYVEKVKNIMPERYSIESGDIGEIVDIGSSFYKVKFDHEIYEGRTTLLLFEHEMEKV